MKNISKNVIRDARLNAPDQGAISSIDEIIKDMRKGKPVILVDDEDRENEGDIILAAEMVTPELINFIAREARGMICLPMEGNMADRLGLQLMPRSNSSSVSPSFTISIEAKEGVTTGISAADRAHTIKVAIDPKSGPNDIATPGHMFPIRAADGGVLVRAGHTEASVDLAKLAGFTGAAAICEIINDDGTMARLPDLIAYAQRHGFKIGTIADLISYRRQRECLVEKILENDFSSPHGAFKMTLYKDKVTQAEHVTLVKGNVQDSDKPVLVRMHAVDFFADILGTGDSTLQKSMAAIDREGRGVIVILRELSPDSLSRRLQKS
ncbi:MAG: 3,4-dihydroxy-2-butanone-4-phosphate synthase, partial [Alphaproteobacteria bacterium]